MPRTSAKPRKPPKALVERAGTIIDRLEKLYPDARIALEFDTPFHLLCAVIMSAQTTDVTVNRVTPELWSRFPTPEALASADIAEVERIIHSTGFYHSKAKNIQATARAIVSDFGGEVPATMEELITLPGVARKTANIVLNSAFGIVVGIAVDTHVLRLSQRWGLTKATDPVKVERDLMAVFEERCWDSLSFRIQLHGRQVCNAKRPICGECGLADVCPSAYRVKGWRESA